MRPSEARSYGAGMTFLDFRATVAEIGGQIALVSVSGELDLYEERSFRDALSAAEALRGRAVVVDLSGLSFMDSTACGVLVGESKRLGRDGCRLALVSNGNSASRVLEVAGIDQIVPVYPTLHAAFSELLLEPVA
jgi:anti-sigma B factor antagonist